MTLLAVARMQKWRRPIAGEMGPARTVGRGASPDLGAQIGLKLVTRRALPTS